MNDRPALAGLSAVKLALLARQAGPEARALLAAEPIAVVGMACRAPGAPDAEALWALVRDGGDAVREVPPDRWDAESWYDPDPGAPGKYLCRRAGFLDRIDGFDAGYFGILPREAERMDPQQRLFLEVGVEALEDAGLPRERLRGARAGVFVAAYHDDYTHLQYSDVESIDARTLTGTLHSVLANRLSYLLDLRGPSLALDTACSSSLVAVHLACQSLRAGECDLALAGGVSLMVTPELNVALSKVGFMAPDGRCKPFDASADGFGRGEGCGAVVLKRLADALADGDRVLAVVRGSAVNQDGRSSVLTAPNGLAHRALIREALAAAQLDPGRVGYVEAHGTGTALGDPIEVEALAETVGHAAAGEGPCHLGSTKANIGHLEAAAGVIGLVKAIQVLRHATIPPQARFASPNPHLSLAGTRLAIPTAALPWPAGRHPRCAAVSSFGVGGTNAHVVLEEAPRLPTAAPAPEVSRILTLSAASAEALRALTETWGRFLPGTDASAADLCHSACSRRTHHAHRLAVVGRTRDDLRARLEAHLRGEPGTAEGRAQASAAVTFVFTGQGPQRPGMGLELAAQEPVFRAALAEVDALLRPLAGWSLLDELARGEAESRLQETVVAQPALFALQVALAALWRAWGVTPAAVVGHSVGEIAALHVAGALQLPEAVRVVWHRARLMQEATGLGRMAQVALSEEEAEAAARPHAGRLDVAAVNGPRAAVLSGERAALDAALEALAARGVAHRALPVQYAFHSAQMAPFAGRLREALGAVAWSAPALPFHSTVTGARLDGPFDADYFARNVRERVRFAPAIAGLAGAGHDLFLELGPHPALGAGVAATLEAAGRPGQALASLRRGQPEREAMLQACAALWVAGASPDFQAVQPDGAPVSLPAYPWQRQRHWLPPPPQGGRRSRAIPVHPVLGAPVELAGPVRAFEGGEGAPAWLGDHRVFGRVALPGAAAAEALLAAGRLALGPRADLVDLALERPLLVPEGGAARWQVVVTPAGPDAATVELHEDARGAGERAPRWRRVASARSGAADDPGSPAPLAPVEAGAALDPAAAYAGFAAVGAAFGPAFRTLRTIRRASNAAEAWVELPEGLTEAGHLLHPVLLDAAFQLCSLAAPAGADGALPAAAWLPAGVARLRVLAPLGARARAVARLRPTSTGDALLGDVELVTPDGVLACVAEGLRLVRAGPEAFADDDGALYELAWEPRRRGGAPRAAGGPWLLVGEPRACDALAAALAAAGERCVSASPGDAYARLGPQAFAFDPARPEDLRRVVQEAGPLARVVHLLALGVEPLARAAPAGWEAESLRSVGSLLHLVQALAAAGTEIRLAVVTRGGQLASGAEPPPALRPHAAAAWGLASVVALEHPELGTRRLDLDPAFDGVDGIAALADELRAGDEASVALRGDERLVPRLIRRAARPPAPGEPVQLAVTRAGSADGVSLRPLARAPLRAGEVRVRVEACGLNFRDVLLALGLYPGEGVLGAECAGEVIEVGPEVRDLPVGARVLGFARGSLATEVVCPAAFVVERPAWLAPEQAATVPVAFLTAWYGLHALAGLRRGERVLVHAAAGGVGLAAVQIAQRAGAEVIATAGSDAKRALLRGMGVRHVFDSRTTSFADGVRAVTGGAGVDVALNALSGALLDATLDVVARGGRLLEIGKRAVLSPEEVRRRRPDVTYHPYDLGGTVEADPPLLRPMLGAVLAAMAAGELAPLPVASFALDDAPAAFARMAHARHVGKIVLRPRRVGPLVRPGTTCWITGGLGGLGLLTARWLADVGATHLLLTGRHPPGEAAQAELDALAARGVTVRVLQADAGDAADTRRALDTLGRELPPLGAVFHAAGALDDGALVTQRWERCRAVMRGKAGGAWLLHALTRDLPLDHFVLYSAAGLLLGAPGQGAYAAANAELDALALARRRLGLPALSVAWGAWGGVGMLATLAAQGRDPWAARGLQRIAPALGFARLEALLREGAAHAAVIPIRWDRFLATLPAGADPAFFGALAAAAPAPPRDAPGAPSLQAELATLLPTRRRPALLAHVAARAAQILGRDAGSGLDPRLPLRELGLDSLMAVELRNALGRSVGRTLPATLAFDHPSVQAIADHLAGLLGLDDGGSARPSDPVAHPDGAHVASLSDAEAEAALLAELERPPRGNPS